MITLAIIDTHLLAIIIHNIVRDTITIRWRIFSHQREQPVVVDGMTIRDYDWNQWMLFIQMKLSATILVIFEHNHQRLETLLLLVIHIIKIVIN